ncbi:MAG: PepSY-like domain-containing protein [Draconibacterium sp.]
MKKSIFVIAVLTISLLACSQTPPKSVTDNFNSKFSGATKVKWDQEEANEWEAEFKLNGEKLSASFDNAGKWLETETEIKKSNLPENVLSAVNSELEGWKIEAVEKLESHDFTGYELSVEKGKQEFEVQVSADGKIISKKKVNEEEEDEK